VQTLLYDLLLEGSDPSRQFQDLGDFLGPIPNRLFLSKLKGYLSEYLNQVKAGNEVLITDRGKPVARKEVRKNDD